MHINHQNLSLDIVTELKQWIYIQYQDCAL